MVKAQTFAQAVINFLHLCDEPYWGNHIINSRIEQADNTTLWSFRIKLSGYEPFPSSLLRDWAVTKRISIHTNQNKMTMKNKQKDTAMAKSRTKNEKAKHVLSVLLDELTKNFWRESIACWTLSGDDGESLMLTLNVYEGYNIPLSRLTEMVEKFEVSTFGLSFRNNGGILEILITLSND